MTKVGKILRVCCAVILMCCCMLAVSCTQERQPCLTPKIASMNMVCVHFPTDTSVVVIKDTALPKALFIPLSDSVNAGVYYGPTANFTLSLSPVADQCTWLFSPDSLASGVDSVHFFYRRQLQFLSNACGYTYFYTLDSVRTTHTNIDSVRITNPSVTNDVNVKQLKVYIHPSF